MALTFDGPPDVTQQHCGSCGSPFTLVKRFVLDDGTAFAIVVAACHHHDGQHEVWIDAVMGDFAEHVSAERITFGCRVGAIEGRPQPAASAVQAAVPYDDTPFWGHKLTRVEALAHPALEDFWRVVDFVLDADPVVHRHLHRRRGLWRRHG